MSTEKKGDDDVTAPPTLRTHTAGACNVSPFFLSLFRCHPHFSFLFLNSISLFRSHFFSLYFFAFLFVFLSLISIYFVLHIQRGVSIIMLEDPITALEEVRPFTEAATHNGSAAEQSLSPSFLPPFLSGLQPLHSQNKVSVVEKCVIAPPRDHTATALSQQRLLWEREYL